MCPASPAPGLLAARRGRVRYSKSRTPTRPSDASTCRAGRMSFHPSALVSANSGASYFPGACELPGRGRMIAGMGELTDSDKLRIDLHAFYWRLYCRALGIDGRTDRAAANKEVNRLLLAIASAEETIAEGAADFLMKDPLPQTDDSAITAAFRVHFQQHAADLMASDRRTADDIVLSLRKLDLRMEVRAA